MLIASLVFIAFKDFIINGSDTKNHNLLKYPNPTTLSAFLSYIANLEGKTGIEEILTTLIFLVITAIPFYLLVGRSQRRFRHINILIFRVWSITWILIIISIIYINTAILNNSINQYWHEVISSITTSSAILVSALILIWIVRSLLDEIFKRWKMFMYPIAIIEDDLVNIIYKCENTKNNWAELEDKRELLLAIETIYQCMARHIPRQLRSGNIVADKQLKDTAQQIAASLLEKTEWIFTPQQDTPSFLAAKMTNTLVCIANGHWHALERAETRKITQPQVWYLLISSSIKILFTIILPVIGFLLLDLSPWKLISPIRDYAIIGLFGWSILTLITTIDPSVSTKLTVAKDVVSLLLPSKKDN